MKRNKKKEKITIGFAALATTLKINGSTTITKNTWLIYWDNIANQSGVTPTDIDIIDEDVNHPDNIVTFEVTFDKPGDYFEFEVDAVNAGTLDAEIISIEKKYNNTLIPAVEDPEHRVVPAYLKYEVTYADTGEPAVGDKLAKRTDATHFTTRTYKIRVEYDREAVTNSDINTQNGNVTHTFSLEVEYGQATPEAAPVMGDFENDEWDTIVSNGCSAYNIGDTKEVDLGSLGTHTVRIANCSTPAICSTEGFSQTACGFVIEFTDIISETYMNDMIDGSTNGDGNKGGWEYSHMRSYLNDTTLGIYAKLPSTLKSAIIPTTVVSGHGRLDSSDFETTDNLYLLSTHEVWEDTICVQSSGLCGYDSAYNKTRQLDYYEGLHVTTGSYSGAIKKNGNNSSSWWLRTPKYDPNDSNSWNVFFKVYSSGQDDTYWSSEDYGVSPAFRIG